MEEVDLNDMQGPGILGPLGQLDVVRLNPDKNPPPRDTDQYANWSNFRARFGTRAVEVFMWRRYGMVVLHVPEYEIDQCIRMYCVLVNNEE
jgi:hypothetical protein